MHNQTTWQLYWRTRRDTIGAAVHRWRWVAVLHRTVLPLFGAHDVDLIECEPVGH